MKDKMIKYGYYIMIVTLLIICTYVLINWLVPLFFSCLIVLVLQPLLEKEIKLLKIKNRLLVKIIIIINYLLFIAIIIMIIIFVIIQIYTVLELLPNYLSQLYDLLNQNHYIINLTKYLDFIYSSSMSVITSISSEFITYLITIVMKIPSILFDLVFMMIMSLFILLDYQRIDRVLIKKYQIIAIIIDTIKDVLINMFKAYFIIMIITFIELWIGFLLIRIDHQIMLACIIAIFDFMPILGLDMIMVPWIIIEALTNHMLIAFGLLITYMVIVITKNILEPRLLAKRLGINPLVSLMGMYLGMKLLGVMGLIIMPSLLMIIVQVIKVKDKLKGEKDNV